MKIAKISLYPSRAEKHIKASGVASYTKNLLTHIPFHDNDAIYMLCNKEQGVDESYKEGRFNVQRVFDRNYKFIFQLLQRLRRVRPEVVHIQQEVPLYGPIYTAVLLQYLVLAFHRRTVVTLHHVVDLALIDRKFVRAQHSKAPVWMVKLGFRVIYMPLIRWAKALIVHEEIFKDILVRQYGARADKIRVIPHGVEEFTPLAMEQSRDRLGIPQGKQVVLFMGYLAGYKGFDLLLEGFAQYARTNPDAYLVIGAGMHPKLQDDKAYIAEYASKQAKAAELIPADQYRWIGFIEENEVGAYYSAADVSVYPYTISLSSSGPMSFAMGYEKPFLASDAFADVLPGEILFERNPDSFAAKLAEFFGDTQTISHVARNMKQERTWSRVGERTFALYREVARQEIAYQKSSEATA